MSEYIRACEQAAKAGGAILQQWRGKFDVREKGPADLVTEADLVSQEKIRELLLSQFPDHDFLGEEDGPLDENSPERDSEKDACQKDAAKSEFQWIVDPLDGTTNYVHGLPNYSVSVALRRSGKIVAGAVYDPSLDECYSAALGSGAWLNGNRIQTSSVTQMSQALLAASFPAFVSTDSPEIGDLTRVMPHCQAFRRLGSAALNLCYVAAGRLDGYWATSTKIWDIAAGVLMVSEAGGVVTSPDGSPLDLDRASFVTASCESLHAELREILGF